MWWAVAAAAAPYVVAALQPKTKRPDAPGMETMPDRSGEMNMIRDQAFNPQNEQWMRASEMAMDQTNRGLGKRGGLGTSIGSQIQGNTQAELANKWLEWAASRQAEAMNLINNYDRTRAGFDADQNARQHEYALAAYADQQQRNANQVKGISDMIGAGVGAYNQYQTQQRYDQMMRPPTASYGTPGQGSYTDYQMPQVGSQYAYNPKYGLGVNYGY